MMSRRAKWIIFGLVAALLCMPRLDGLAFLTHVRSAGNPIPAIVVSGSWTAEQRDRARELGADHLLVKPDDLAQIARDVEELAGRAE